MATSRIPTIVDAIISALRDGGLARIYDGPELSGEYGDAIFIGYDGDPEGDFASVRMTQSAASLGMRARDEFYSIVCAIIVTTGGDATKPIRDKVFELMAVVESVLRANPSMSQPNSPTVVEIKPQEFFLEPGLNVGMQARITFDIDVRDRI